MARKDDAMTPFQCSKVAAKFDAYPPAARGKLMHLRELVLRTARSHPRVGEIEETLKWGEPAYVTVAKTGSTVRIDWKPKNPSQYAMYFNCRTRLVETFRQLFPQDFRFEGNRALVLDLDAPMPGDALSVCIEAALTYHLQPADRR